MANHSRDRLVALLFGWRPADEAERSFANLVFMAGLPDQAAYDDQQTATLGLLAMDLGAADFWLAQASSPAPEWDLTDEGRAAHRAIAELVAGAQP